MNIASSKLLRKRTVLISTLALIGVSLLVLPDNAVRRAMYIGDIEHNLENVWDPVKDTDTAVFWHIPKSGGTSMKRYYSCMGLVEATQMGTTNGHDKDKTIQVWEDRKGQKYVNVDTTKEEGMIRAEKLEMAQSGLANVVFTLNPLIATDMFSQEYQGKFFTMLRHPNDRTVSWFYFTQIASWQKSKDSYNPELADTTIEDWLKDRSTAISQGNSMIRLLLEKYRHVVTERDLKRAKEMLRTKFLVGLMARMEESVDRFDRYFGWYDSEKRPECQDLFVDEGANRNPHEEVKEGSEAWELLTKMNSFDIRLYEYAVELFDEQAELFQEGRSFESTE